MFGLAGHHQRLGFDPGNEVKYLVESLVHAKEQKEHIWDAARLLASEPALVHIGPSVVGPDHASRLFQRPVQGFEKPFRFHSTGGAAYRLERKQFGAS